MKPKKPAQKNSAIDYGFAVFAGLIIGGVLGGIGGFFLPSIYYGLVSPDILQDGQYGLIYLASVPFGALVGAVLGIGFLCFQTAKVHADN